MATEVSRKKCGEYEIVGLRSESIEVAVAPEVGAKIVSLRDLKKNREWMWSASDDRRLFGNQVGDVFDDSPLVGADECIPTVAPCKVDGKDWFDHGEVWARSWDLDQKALDSGILATEIELETVPMTFRRELSIKGNKLRIDYRLEHKGEHVQSYAWAFHPLMEIRGKDRLELPVKAVEGRVDSAEKISGLHTGKVAGWPEPIPGMRVDKLLEGTDGTSLKLYIPSPEPAEFTIINDEDGTTLRGAYGPAELLPYLGIWVTRGGWNGFHHFAVEPTNVDDDRADRIDAKVNTAALIAPGSTRQWFIELSV